MVAFVCLLFLGLLGFDRFVMVLLADSGFGRGVLCLVIFQHA